MLSLPLRSALVCLVAILAVSPAHAGVPPEKRGVNLYLVAAGAALMAGGGFFAHAQHREANRDMRVYRRSAFTAPTEDYRARVEEHQRLAWVGLAGATLGGILLVVAF